jgi:methyl coenzyme M reductase beta subunit
MVLYDRNVNKVMKCDSVAMWNDEAGTNSLATFVTLGARRTSQHTGTSDTLFYKCTVRQSIGGQAGGSLIES